MRLQRLHLSSRFSPRIFAMSWPHSHLASVGLNCFPSHRVFRSASIEFKRKLWSFQKTPNQKLE